MSLFSLSCTVLVQLLLVVSQSINSSATSTESAGVPVIDLSELGKDVRVSHSIDMALQQYGLFIGVNAMEDFMYDKFMQAAYDFFHLPLEEKEKIEVVEAGGFMRGYIPFGSESGLKNKFFEPKEGFAYGYPFEQKTETETEYVNALEGPNVWPEKDVYDGEGVMNFMFKLSTTIAMNICRSLSASYKFNTKEELGLTLEDGDHISIMRLFHYFAKNDNNMLREYPSESLIGSSPHTDWGLLTVITQEQQVGGLQVFHKGAWLDVPSHYAKSVVVNGGDFLSMVSNGRYKSPIHRVQSPDYKNRISYVYFFYPNFHSPIDMTSSFKEKQQASLSGEEEQYNTLVSGDILEGIGENKKIVFGDFILKKWKGVFRSE